MKAQNPNPLFNVAEIKVSYQPKFKACDRPKITRSCEAFSILLKNWNQAKIQLCEQFYILVLNNSGNVIGMTEISNGGFSQTVVDPKMVFSIALKGCASGIILSHSHPSGNLKPSDKDLYITRTLVEVGKLLDLKVLDHLIITSNGYFSFGDDGLIQRITLRDPNYIDKCTLKSQGLSNEHRYL